MKITKKNENKIESLTDKCSKTDCCLSFKTNRYLIYAANSFLSFFIENLYFGAQQKGIKGKMGKMTPSAATNRS